MLYAADMTDQSAKRARGRPRDPTKRVALLAAARELFLERGSEAVTMDQVLSRAGVSRATLYSNFANKSELLTAVIDAESKRIFTEQWANDHLEQSTEEKLIRLGAKLLHFIAEADTLAFERLIAQAALADPGYGTRFFAAGPGRIRSIVMAIIHAGQERGELQPCDTETAANDLLGLWQGFWRLEIQYGHRPAADPAELDRLVHHGVKQFLSLYSAHP